MANKTFICPSSSIEYSGPCQVINCPANVTHIPGRESGCAYTFLNNKPDIGKYEIAYAFATTNKAVDTKIAEGRINIKKLILFYQILNKFRTAPPKQTCSKCSIKRNTIGDCLNKLECNKRTKLITKIIGQYPFNLTELDVTANDLYQLIIHRDRIVKQIASVSDQQFGINDVFGLTPAIANKFFSMKTEI